MREKSKSINKTELVECHSGHEYAERPRAFFWQGCRMEINRINSQGRIPKGKFFHVTTSTGELFLLTYIKSNDIWQVEPE